MTGRKEKKGEIFDAVSIFKKPLSDGFRFVLDKIKTGPGRMNFYCDIILSIVVLVIVLSKDLIADLSQLIVLIIRPENLQYLHQTSNVVLLLILVSFFSACLVFTTFIEREWKDRESRKKKEDSAQ